MFVFHTGKCERSIRFRTVLQVEAVFQSHRNRSSACRKVPAPAHCRLEPMQSPLGATLTLSIERIVATAVGAAVGAVEENYFGANLIAFMLAIFSIGLVSLAFRLEKTAYPHASVTLRLFF